MDSFTLAVFIILIMLAINANQPLIGAALAVILVVSLRSMGLIVITVIGILLGVMFNVTTQVLWLLIGIVILSVFLLSKKEEGAGAYSPGGW